MRQDESEIDGCICDVLSFNPNDYRRVMRLRVCIFSFFWFVRACLFSVEISDHARVDPLHDAENVFIY